MGRSDPTARGKSSVALCCLLTVAGCGLPVVADAGPCRLDGAPVLLPREVLESSGVESAWSRGAGDSVADPLLWTHDDSGPTPLLHLVDRAGALRGILVVEGAEMVDWEDLAAGPCGEGRCLYVADTGDNVLRREETVIYRIVEPAPVPEAEPSRAAVPVREADARTEAGLTPVRMAGPSVRIPLRFPDGPRDVEALAVLPDGRALLISKGRAGGVEVYRTPERVDREEPSDDADAPSLRRSPILLELVQTLGEPPLLPRYVTGAAASPDGRLLVVRTYETLAFFRVGAGGRLEPMARATANLRPLREPQGEGVAFIPGNRVVLTSEAGPGGRRGQMTFLRCEVAGERW